MLKCVCVGTLHLFTAFNDTTAQVATGFGVDHGGHVFLCLQISEELLTTLSLLPVHTHRQTHTQFK